MALRFASDQTTQSSHSGGLLAHINTHLFRSCEWLSCLRVFAGELYGNSKVSINERQQQGIESIPCCVVMWTTRSALDESRPAHCFDCPTQRREKRKMMVDTWTLQDTRSLSSLACLFTVAHKAHLCTCFWERPLRLQLFTRSHKEAKFRQLGLELTKWV